jgi:hypothetical protein
VLIGFPSEATDMMRDLTEKPTLEDWWPWLLTFVSGRKQNATPRSAQQERLFDLAAKLTVIRQRFAEQDIHLPATEVFRFWTPYVARFSFQAGRLSATVSDAPAAPATEAAKTPASRRTSSTSSTIEPRDSSEAS